MSFVTSVSVGAIQATILSDATPFPGADIALIKVVTDALPDAGALTAIDGKLNDIKAVTDVISGASDAIYFDQNCGGSLSTGNDGSPTKLFDNEADVMTQLATSHLSKVVICPGSQFTIFSNLTGTILFEGDASCNPSANSLEINGQALGYAIFKNLIVTNSGVNTPSYATFENCIIKVAIDGCIYKNCDMYVGNNTGIITLINCYSTSDFTNSGTLTIYNAFMVNGHFTNSGSVIGLVVLIGGITHYIDFCSLGIGSFSKIVSDDPIEIRNMTAGDAISSITLHDASSLTIDVSCTGGSITLFGVGALINNIAVGVIPGTMTETLDPLVMTDAAATFVPNALVGLTINNTTDIGANGVITANDVTTITVSGLSGGILNTWTLGDGYTVPFLVNINDFRLSIHR
jgi:hypothetical protein